MIEGRRERGGKSCTKLYIGLTLRGLGAIGR